MCASDNAHSLTHTGGFQTLRSLSCCSPLPKGLNPNHNKQQAQEKNTSFSDFPSITHVPSASQRKHSSTTTQDKYWAIGRGALH